ncbi:hypothetical protein ACPRNU_13835 [Chromobacterium vaccinii]|uniref:hypothetical protein n=1 Tax=Chromobacterium vaccinii TaxID=1108595 RepID=UPI003C78BF09
MSTELDVKGLAAQLQNAFGPMESDSSQIILKDQYRPMLESMVHAAHGDMLPDDHRYQFITDAVEALANYDDPEEAIEAIQPDVYTHDLTKWLASNNSRLDYLSEAITACQRTQVFRVEG